MKKKGVVKGIVERVWEMYRGSINKVKFGGESSVWLQQKMGLRQRSTLWLLLFIIGKDEVLEELARIKEEKMKGCDTWGWFDGVWEKWRWSARTVKWVGKGGGSVLNERK